MLTSETKSPSGGLATVSLALSLTGLDHLNRLAFRALTLTSPFYTGSFDAVGTFSTVGVTMVFTAAEVCIGRSLLRAEHVLPPGKISNGAYRQWMTHGKISSSGMVFCLV